MKDLKKFHRRRYLLHSKLKGVEGFNHRKRNFNFLNTTNLSESQLKAFEELRDSFKYDVQLKLF